MWCLWELLRTAAQLLSLRLVHLGLNMKLEIVHAESEEYRSATLI